MRTKRRISVRQGRRERGQALVEFGLVSIVFFMFIFGIMDGARLFQSWMTVQHASREAARYAITGLASCQGAANRTDCIEWKAKDATTGLTRGGPGATDTDVAVTFKAWDYSTWSGSGTANATGKQCDQIEVTVTYNHKFATPFFEMIAPSGVNISGRQRMTNEPWGNCIPGDGVTTAP
jgi:Flp pilus assembly protein TadG